MNAIHDLNVIAAASDPIACIAAEALAAEGVKSDAEAVLTKAQAGDAGAPFEPAAIATLRALQANSLTDWMRLRVKLKEAGSAHQTPNPSCTRSLMRVDRALAKR